MCIPGGGHECYFFVRALTSRSVVWAERIDEVSEPGTICHSEESPTTSTIRSSLVSSSACVAGRIFLVSTLNTVKGLWSAALFAAFLLRSATFPELTAFSESFLLISAFTSRVILGHDANKCFCKTSGRAFDTTK